MSETKKIPLSKGYEATVDEKWFSQLSSFKWYVLIGKNGRVYAVRETGSRDQRKTILMHRVICEAPPNMDVDHINHDGLDNRSNNLRIASRSQNLANQRVQPGSTSKYKGVDLDKRPKRLARWRATITKNQQTKHIGYFKTEYEAACAYDAAAVDLFGLFANINIKDSLAVTEAQLALMFLRPAIQ